jgi:hypothetical protein
MARTSISLALFLILATTLTVFVESFQVPVLATRPATLITYRSSFVLLHANKKDNDEDNDEDWIDQVLDTPLVNVEDGPLSELFAKNPQSFEAIYVAITLGFIWICTASLSQCVILFSFGSFLSRVSHFSFLFHPYDRRLHSRGGRAPTLIRHPCFEDE